MVDNSRRNVGGYGGRRNIVIIVILLCIVILSLSNLQVFNAGGRNNLSNFVVIKFSLGVYYNNKNEDVARQELIRQRQKLAATMIDIESSSNNDDNEYKIDYDDPIIQNFLRNHGKSSTSTSSLLPKIYLDYFIWHYTQMKEINTNPELVYTKKFIIMECHYKGIGYNNRNGVGGGQCGGISDRLTSLPMLLYLAAINKRLLFIVVDDLL